MIALKSTAELRLVFNKLIKTLSVPVDWNGNFIVIDNFLILPGKERSVIFNYDTRRVTTNISDPKLGNARAMEIGKDSQLVNIFNLVLYAFGKWGALKGITVEKDYKKINTLFGAVFGQIGVTAEYTEQHCFWYKDGTRITYEDAIQETIDSEARRNAAVDEEEAEEETGLWHSTVWKLADEHFPFEKLSMAQRRKDRIGNNFYKVGYSCPHCGKKLYMASFSKQEKPVIDTVEGRVQLARAFFCPECIIFYTPLPDAGLEDDEAYYLDFDGDRTAGTDYMEMLGKQGSREPNSEFNRYLDRVKDSAQPAKRENLNDIDKGIRDGRRNLNGVDKGISDDRVDLNGVDKGIRDERRNLNGVDKGIRDERRSLNGIDKGISDERADLNGVDKGIRDERVNLNGVDKGIRDERRSLNGVDKGIRDERVNLNGVDKGIRDERRNLNGVDKGIRDERANLNGVDKGIRDERRSLNGVDKGIRDDRVDLNGVDKGIRDERRSLNGVDKGIRDDRVDLNGVDKGIRDERRSLNGVDKGIRDERADLNGVDKGIHDDRADLDGADKGIRGDCDDLGGASEDNVSGTGRYVSDTGAEMRVRDAAKKSPKKAAKRLKINLFPRLAGLFAGLCEKAALKRAAKADRKYNPEIEDTAADSLNMENGAEKDAFQAQRKEAEKIMETSSKSTRGDFNELLKAIKKKHFPKAVEKEYLARIHDEIASLDKRRMDEACGHYLEYDSDELEGLYNRIREEEFLPEIKDAALETVSKRLWKIRNEEAGLLVKRLKNGLAENGVTENERMYFYPAEEVLDGNADSELLDHIENACDAYAPELGEYEYPVIMQDATKRQSGKRGLFVTPDAIYYGNLYTYGRISAEDIERIDTVSGFFGTRMVVYLVDGSKVKLPDVVGADELGGYLKTINEFVEYLKQKPFSRKEKYLAKENHEVICCFRCGFVYKDMRECPKCGYKFNV